MYAVVIRLYTSVELNSSSNSPDNHGLLASSLVETQLYKDELIKGQLLLNQRQQEYLFNHPSPARPVHKQLIPQVKPAEQLTPNIASVKVWPELLLRAMQSKHAGAYRLYFLLRAFDKQGNSNVKRSDLLAYLNGVGLDERQRRRWLADALSIGLLSEKVRRSGVVVYSLAGLVKACSLVDCSHLGRPASIASDGLIKPGWRALVWGCYLATLHERPISQKTKEQLTGVSERVQRTYQRSAPGEVRHNFAFTRLFPEHIEGAAEVRGHHFLTVGRHVYQRLPDIRLTPGFVTPGRNGRSRKVQKQINNTSLSIPGQAKGVSLRLFCESPEQVKATQRQLRSLDIPPWELPAELFEVRHCGVTSNLWASIPTGETIQ